MGCEKAEEVSPMPMNIGFILMTYCKKAVPVTTEQKFIELILNWLMLYFR